MNYTDGKSYPAGFTDWLRDGLANGELACNQSGAMIHFVPEGMLLVSPAIFQSYASVQKEGWMNIQKSFLKSRRALQDCDGRYIWRYQVFFGRKATGVMLNGVVVAEPREFINEVAAVNPILRRFDGRLVDVHCSRGTPYHRQISNRGIKMTGKQNNEPIEEFLNQPMVTSAAAVEKEWRERKERGEPDIQQRIMTRREMQEFAERIRDAALREHPAGTCNRKGHGRYEAFVTAGRMLFGHEFGG